MIYLFDRTFKVNGILMNNNGSESCAYWDDVHVEYVKTGSSSYSFKTFANHLMTRDIAVGGYCSIRDLDNDMQMFQILQIKEVHGDLSLIEVYAENVGLELLNDITRPFNHGAKNVRQALQIILQDTDWLIGSIDKDINNVSNLNWSGYKTVFDRLEELTKNYDCELKFKIQYKNGEVLGKYIDVFERRGEDTYKRFEYGKDIKEISRTVDMTELVTALVGVGEDGTTFKSLSWSTENGNLCTKPLNEDFVKNNTALNTYNRHGNHIFAVYEYNTKDKALLLEKTYKELIRRSKPRIEYEMDLALLERLVDLEHEKVRIGDTVRVIDNTFYDAVHLEARVVELHTSYTNPEQDKCVLSNYTEIRRSSIETVATNVRDGLNDLRVTVKNTNDSVDNLGSKVVIVQDTEPVLPAIDQIWCNTSTTPPTWKKWDGLTWNDCIGITADAVISGILQAQNGVTTLNLDDGSFRMGGSQFFRIGTSDTNYKLRFNYSNNGKLEIDGDIISTGTFNRAWNGTTTTSTVELSFSNGYVRANNKSLTRSVYLSDFGLSTRMDGTEASGTIEFFSDQYSAQTANKGITMYSDGGIVGLVSRTKPVQISPEWDVNGANTYSFQVRNDVDSSKTDGFLFYGSHANGWGSGLRFAKSSANSFVQAMKGDGTTGDFKALGLFANSVKILDETAAENFYIGLKTEARVMNMTFASYMPIRASSFPTGSSVRYKDNIKPFEEDAIGLLSDVNVYEYYLKADLENGIYDKKRVGLLSEAIPSLLRDEDGVDTYTILSVVLQAFKQQQQMIQTLQTNVQNLEEVIATWN